MPNNLMSMSETAKKAKELLQEYVEQDHCVCDTAEQLTELARAKGVKCLFCEASELLES